MDSVISVEIARLYVSFFNRAPDPEGLQYWVSRYASEVADGADGARFLEEIADSFAQSPEAKAIYETSSNPTDAQIHAYIEEAYLNMFGRVPDVEGRDYWTARWKAEMAEGKPGVRVLFEIENAARGSTNQNDVAALQNKAEVAAKFTTDFIDSGAEWTPENMEKAKTIIDNVDHTPESVQQAEKDIADYVDEVLGGQEPNPGPVNPGPVTPPPPPPVDTAVEDFGEVAEKAQDGPNNLWIGGGNAAGNFNITTTTLSQVELALKGYHRGVGDVVHNDGVYKFRDTDKAGFAFSVASLGDKTIAELMSEGYSFHLKIDTDGGVGFGDAVELTLAQLGLSSPTPKAQDSGYDWVTTGGAIVDDEGDGSISAGGYVTQNIQTPIWYDNSLDLGGGKLKDGEYSVSLEMRKGGNTVATETIVLDVVASDKGYVGTVANIDGMMLNGTNNPADKFNIVELNLDQEGGTDLILGLGGQQQGGPAIFTPDNGNMAVDASIKPALKWSVESSDGKSLADILADYNIVLSVDTNGAEAGGIINFNAVLSSDNVGLDWVFMNGTVEDAITDDMGNANVSQNIQALSWLIPSGPVEGKELFIGGSSTVAPGEYFAFLKAYDKVSSSEVGSVGVIFDVDVLP